MTLISPPVSISKPAIWTLEQGSKLIRFCDQTRGGWDAHRFYGPLPSQRFDHHAPPLCVSLDRSVWYAATSLVGAVAEAFGNLGVVDRACGRHVALVQIVRPLILMNLVGVSARRVGLTQEVGSSTDYAKTQEWARAFYDQCGTLMGIRWRGRQAGSICFVLHDRATMSDLALVSDHNISDPRVWPRIVKAARACSLSVI